MNQELKEFVYGRGIATSRTTIHNTACNALVEKLNGTQWKAISTVLKTHYLPTSLWQEVLADILHGTCICTLLFTSTNETAHERLLNFQRRSTTG